MWTRACFTVVAIAACGSAGHAPSSAEPAPKVGPQPVLSVAVWPERWSTITAMPQARALGIPLPASFWELARDAGKEVGLKDLALPPPGLDPSGPIVAEIGQPHGTFEAIAAAAAKHDMKALKDSFGLRVRVTLPARDVAALAGALESALPKEKHSRPSVRVVRGEHAVALDLSFDEQAMQDSAAPPAVAIAFDAGHDSAARAALRLPGLADLGAMTGMLRTMGALAMVERKDVKELLMQGTSEVLTGYLLVDPATSISDALLVDVPVKGTPVVAFELTDAGKTALAAGGLAEGKRTALDAVKWSALLDATPRPAVVDNAKGASGVATLFHECGAFCFAYVAMGNGLGFASALGGGDVGAMIKQASGQLGVQLADVGWTGSLVYLLPAGATEPVWKVPATGVAQSAAEKCYRHALLDVRGALRAGSLEVADKALESTTSCVSADPAVAARHRDLREFVLTLRGS